MDHLNVGIIIQEHQPINLLWKPRNEGVGWPEPRAKEVSVFPRSCSNCWSSRDHFLPQWVQCWVQGTHHNIKWTYECVAVLPEIGRKLTSLASELMFQQSFHCCCRGQTWILGPILSIHTTMKRIDGCFREPICRLKPGPRMQHHFPSQGWGFIECNGQDVFVTRHMS